VCFTVYSPCDKAGVIIQLNALLSQRRKTNKYQTVEKVPRSNVKIVETEAQSPNTYIHYRSFMWLSTDISIKS
jgi:hypothetical protein